MTLARIRSFVYLISYSARRQFRSKKTLLAALFLGLIAMVIYVTGLRRPWDAKHFGQEVVLAFHTLFFLPIVALMFGTGALGDDRDENTLVYLLTRPIHRGFIYLGKLVSVIPHVLAFAVGGLALLWVAARAQGLPDLDGQLWLYLPGVALSALAYASFFHLLSALFRHSTMLSIVYVFLVEVVVGQLPGVIKRISISFYTWSILYEEASSSGLEPNAYFFPITAASARLVLVSLAIGFLLIGAAIFQRKDYHESAG